MEDTDGGTTAYLVATGSDITEALEAQAAEVDVLRRAQDLFRSALDAMLDNVAIGHAVRDGDGEIVDYELSFVNRSSVEGGARSADDLVGVRLTRAVPGVAAVRTLATVPRRRRVRRAVRRRAHAVPDRRARRHGAAPGTGTCAS